VSAARRVLVVDDNADAADSLAMLLQVRGDDVRVAYDGEEALFAEQEFMPDVLLLDIGMPKLSGYEVARRARAAVC
jgi:DNA-binding response OmpR family regulator